MPQSRTTTRRRPQRTSSRRQKGLLARYGYKKIGIAVIAIGAMIAVTGGFAAWQEIKALSAGTWTYVGIASQYEVPVIKGERANKNQVVADVYACKQAVAGVENAYKVKAKAIITSNSATDDFGNPRLEILPTSATTPKYAFSKGADALSKPGTTLTTEYTEAVIRKNAMLYYGLNALYQNNKGGSTSYAFAAVANLTNC